ncbi:MAG: hypothetical protein GTO02_11595 [Candidatus Dadabacteria bacterium]|nr:hypothetical protein [Candidatus Dadabacteria bacterium]NIQ14999.1 hypothetical protein [Candidatus Dadabacteria bacterium]
MKIFKYLVVALILAVPTHVYSGAAPEPASFLISRTDAITTETDYEQIFAVYDLRDRKSYIQVTYPDSIGPGSKPSTIPIHVQIFQHDRGCDELNFFDELTLNDTVVYDMDNIVRNDGSNVPVNLAEDSYGYVVVTIVEPGGSVRDFEVILGNFRIIDDAGYEYRTNMPWQPIRNKLDVKSTNSFVLNFNTVDGANQADIYAFGVRDLNTDASFENLDEGLTFSVFVFDMNEEPLSCDQVNFACGNNMYYGINDDYPASKGGPVLCEGGGLSNPDGGFISLEDATHTGLPDFHLDEVLSFDHFLGFIGINNGDGTGSMDTWYQRRRLLD